MTTINRDNKSASSSAVGSGAAADSAGGSVRSDRRAVLLSRPSAGSGSSIRLTAIVFMLVSLGLLLIASGLTPAGIKGSTHQQLGLPPCGFLTITGKPCATCGMTTAFAYAAHESFFDSFRAQPMGMLLALATAAVFWGGLYCAAVRSPACRLYAPLISVRAIWIYAVLFLAAWGYKLVTF